MEGIREKIEKVQHLREEMLQAETDYKIGTQPVISDRRKIPKSYEIFKQVESGVLPREMSRVAFIFVVFYIFCPKHFCTRMGSGVRRDIAKILKTHPSSVSNLSHKTIIYYKSYKDFRKVVDDAIVEIEKVLG